jgi:flagellar hook-length control protein FliK
MIDRIVRAAKLTQSRGVARLRLVLTPPELGELRLDLSIRQKTLHATLQADRSSAAEAILAQLPALKEALERHGFTLGDFSVGSDGAFAQAQGDSRRDPGGRGEGSTSDAPVPEPAPAVAAASLHAQIVDLKA